jgi:hypothetical protein
LIFVCAAARTVSLKIDKYRNLLIVLYFSGAAKRIRTPDPRTTNPQVFLAMLINQYLTNGKRDLWQQAPWKICLCWYKSGHSNLRQSAASITPPLYQSSLRIGVPIPSGRRDPPTLAGFSGLSSASSWRAKTRRNPSPPTCRRQAQGRPEPLLPRWP